MVTIKRCDNCSAEGANSADIRITVIPERGNFKAPTVKALSCDLCEKCFEKAAKIFKPAEAVPETT